MLNRLKDWARVMARETVSLYLATRHPGTPWYAKVLAALVVAYALSPIDLIPDFLPVIGYLDDLLLLPIGLWLCVRMIPDEVMAECRARAAGLDKPPVSRPAAVVIVLLWLAGAAVLGWILCGAVAAD